MDETAPSTISIVRLSFKPEASDKVAKSTEWFDALRALKSEPNWRYTTFGLAVDDPLTIILFIAWAENTTAPPSYRSPAALTSPTHPLHAPLAPLLAQPPALLLTFHPTARLSPNALATTYTHGTNEIVTVRGPRPAVARVCAAVAHSIRTFLLDREGARLADEVHREDAFHGLVDGWCAADDDDDDGDGGGYDDDEAQQQQQQRTSTFVFVFGWASRAARDEFRDPTARDPGLSEGLRRVYGDGEFWQRCVGAPLRGLVEEGEGAVVESVLDYWDARVAVDERGRVMVREEGDW